MIRNDYIRIILDMDGKYRRLATMSNAEFKPQTLIDAINYVSLIVNLKLYIVLWKKYALTDKLPNSISLILIVGFALEPLEVSIVNCSESENLDEKTLDKIIDKAIEELNEKLCDRLSRLIICTPDFKNQNF